MPFRLLGIRKPRRAGLGLDYFDASINRIAAWVIGMRNVQRALMLAMLASIDPLREWEAAGDFSRRPAMLEELKGMPFGAV